MFVVAVLFTALAAIAVWLVVRDAPPGHPFLARTPESPREMLDGLLEVLGQPSALADPGAEFLLLCMHLHGAGAVGRAVPARGAWADPPIQAGNVLLAAVIAYQCRHAVIRPARPPVRYAEMDCHRRQRSPSSCCLRRWRIAAAAAALAARRCHRRHRLLQRLLHHGDDARPRHLPGPADRARHCDHQHRRDVRRRLHADAVRR